MGAFKYFLSPNDPNGVYVLSSICAEVGSIGVLIASFLRSLINSSNTTTDWSDCTWQKIQQLDAKCLRILIRNMGKGLWWSQFSHLIIMLLGIITCIPFFAMEDLFSVHEGASVMRNCLIAGTVLEIMSSAFKVGIRSATGVTGYFFAPDEGKNINVYPAMAMASSMLRNCFTWVTFFRDAILAVGVYISAVYDKEANVIGGTWRVLGWITAICGALNTVMEFLKVFNYGFFDSESDYTYYMFLIVYTAWLFVFGMHCKSLTAGEGQGMLGNEDAATSGSEVSDDEPVAAAAAAPAESSEEEEAPKKKRRHHKKQEESDDDV